MTVILKDTITIDCGEKWLNRTQTRTQMYRNIHARFDCPTNATLVR